MFSRSTDTASIYLSAVMEYLLMELATICAENTESNMATKSLVQIVINNDDEYSKLFF